MLYHLHEMGRTLFSPLSHWADMTSKLLTHPVSPFAHTPFAQRIAASFEVFHRLGKVYQKPAFNLESTVCRGKKVPIVEEIILKKDFCHLRHFKKVLSNKEGALQQPKVLLVAPLSGHHATLLRDTVRALLTEHDVYITDWVDARIVPLSQGPFHLKDYVYYVRDFIRHLGPHLHVIAVCQPTVPVMAAVSLMSSQKDPLVPSTMILMGGPVDPRKSPTQVNSLATEKSFSWFEHHMIYKVPTTFLGHGRRVYPGFLQHTGFVAMNPSRHAQSHWDFYQHLVMGDNDSAEAHRQFYDEYNAVLDLPAEFYLETIKTVFQEFRLAEGTWDIDGQTVRPQDIKHTALLTIEGELDDISGPGQTQAAHALCTGIPKNRQQDFLAPNCGHYGIFSGKKWREVVYPKVAAFIQKYAE